MEKDQHVGKPTNGGALPFTSTSEPPPSQCHALAHFYTNGDISTDCDWFLMPGSKGLFKAMHRSESIMLFEQLSPRLEGYEFLPCRFPR